MADMNSLKDALSVYYNAAYSNTADVLNQTAMKQKQGAMKNIGARNMMSSGSFERGALNDINTGTTNALKEVVSQGEFQKAGAETQNWFDQRNRQWSNDDFTRDSIGNVINGVTAPILGGVTGGLGSALKFGIEDKLSPDLLKYMYDGKKHE